MTNRFSRACAREAETGHREVLLSKCIFFFFLLGTDLVVFCSSCRKVIHNLGLTSMLD